MVELAHFRLTPARGARMRPRHRQVVHRELPWLELALKDDQLRELLTASRELASGYWVPRAQINRVLLVLFGVSLLLWLMIAFAVVEVLAAT